MQIRIEIDVKPEELRRFLGLPDVAGLQEDVVQFLREKVGAASETFDPANFVRENFQTIKRSGAWQKIVAAAKSALPDLPPVPEPPPSKKRRRAAASAGKGRKRATRPADAGQGPPEE